METLSRPDTGESSLPSELMRELHDHKQGEDTSLQYVDFEGALQNRSNPYHAV